MKVALDLTALLPEPSGVDTYLTGLVGALAAIDGESRYTVYVNREDRDLFSLPPNFTVVAAASRPRLARLAFQQARLPLVALGQDADVVHSPSFLMPLCRGRQRHVVTVHDLTSLTRPDCHLRLRRSRAYRAALALSIRHADRIVVPSSHVKRELERRFPSTRGQRVRAIPHGIGSEFRPAPVESVHRVRGRLGLPDRYLLYVGTLEPRKNLVCLVRAYRHLVERHGVEESLVLAGRLGWGNAPLLQAVDEPPLRNRVCITGYVPADDLPAVYAGARAFVYPSLDEGFGFPPLEAMATGIPTISSNSSSLRENLDGAAELVSPTDWRSLAAAIHRVLLDEALRERLRRAGRERATAFTWERSARETRACYEELARLRARRRVRAARVDAG